jgi:hypothetical protein
MTTVPELTVPYFGWFGLSCGEGFVLELMVLEVVCVRRDRLKPGWLTARGIGASTHEKT